MQSVKLDPHILPRISLVGKIGIDKARTDQKSLPGLKLIPTGSHSILPCGIQTAAPRNDIVEQVVVADEGPKGVQRFALLISVLIDTQIQKIFIGKDGK